ncbi:glutamine amidotransferase family protein [Terrarubrum flagellatum]|uniref:class II glutamine amidotransferase n=1 Tax=Terrirubrum flagellatum TaxID=2895980 RepID=UPI0031451D64
MCGIVGLFLKDPALEPQLGALIAPMLASMSDRGPDSAGFAIYGAARESETKLTVQSKTPDESFGALQRGIVEAGLEARIERRETHAVVYAPAAAQAALAALIAAAPELRVMASGEAIEIYKEVGSPRDVAQRFDLAGMAGTHAIGHTRMATESAVTILGAHPFSTGPDQCLVHNGSLSNHNDLRRALRREGLRFETENDTEVAAAYLTQRMAQGRGLADALQDGLADLDGFYTFVVGARRGFAVLRDRIACKPAILAETDRYVAFGSEYRALVDLPGIEAARVWEPEPATVYAWEH